MPSEEVVNAAFEATANRRHAFLSAVSFTASQVRTMVDAERAAAAHTTERTSALLGQFASGRIKAQVFAKAIAPPRQSDAGRQTELATALAVLEEIEGRGDDLFRLRIEAGGDLQGAVEHALSDAGRAFAAARVATGSATAESAIQMKTGFPFRKWSRAERRLAPPLVVEVEGGDLVVSGLAPALDGSACIILAVSGSAPSAAMARLVAPGVTVAQVDAAQDLADMLAGGGPAAVAIVPGECARFAHRPSGEAEIAAIEVQQAPSKMPVKPIGSVSSFQQQQDLAWLEALVTRSAAPAVAVAPAAVSAPEPVLVEAAVASAPANGHEVSATPAIDPVGTLAAWLLSRVDLSNLEGN